MTIHFAEFVLPLFEAEIIEDPIKDANSFKFIKYIGNSFFVNSSGVFATCRHVIDSIDSKHLIIGKNFHHNIIHRVTEIRKHADYDFAIGFVNNPISRFLTPYHLKDILGENIDTVGFIENGKIDKSIRIDPRFIKGNIVRTASNNIDNIPGAKSINEVSFPSLSGFSGSPVFVDGLQLIGMLYGNTESSIEVYGYNQIQDDGKEYAESVRRIMEYGLFHNLYDIIDFMKDLNFTDYFK